MIHRTTYVADAVLAIVEGLAFEIDLTLEPYQNGREHGWALHNYRTGNKVAFSENRNSDDIVVYLGKCVDFAFAGNVPSDKVYHKGAYYFSYDAHYKAAERIVKYLKEEINENL